MNNPKTKHTPGPVKSARELYADSIDYVNLRRHFAQVMQQYKDLEERVTDQAREIEKLERICRIRAEEIKRLNEALAKATGGAE